MGGGKDGGGGSCQNYLTPGNRTYIFCSKIDPKKFKPGRYDLAMILRSYNYSSTAGGYGLGQERFCAYNFERRLTISVNYLRLSTQGDPFLESDPVNSPKLQSNPYLNFTILANRKYKDISDRSIEPSFVVSSNIKHPVDVLYNLFRRFLNIPITKIRYKQDSPLKYNIYVPVLNEQNEVIDFTSYVYNYNNLFNLKQIINFDLGIFSNSSIPTDIRQIIGLSMSATITNEKLSDIIQKITTAGRILVFYDSKGKINILQDGGYRLDDKLVITDLEEVITEKNSIKFETPDLTKIPYKIEVSFPLALYNFSYTKYFIEVPEILKYFNPNSNANIPLDFFYSQDYYTRGISNKQISLTIDIAPDLPLYLAYGSFNELYNVISNKYGNKDYFKNQNLAYKISNHYQIYILKIIQENIYKVLFVNTLTLKMNSAALLLSPGEVIRIEDKNYDYLNGRYLITSIKQVNEGEVEVTLREYVEDIYKPNIDFFHNNPFPILNYDISTIQ